MSTQKPSAGLNCVELLTPAERELTALVNAVTGLCGPEQARMVVVIGATGSGSKRPDEHALMKWSRPFHFTFAEAERLKTRCCCEGGTS